MRPLVVLATFLVACAGAEGMAPPGPSQASQPSTLGDVGEVTDAVTEPATTSSGATTTGSATSSETGSLDVTTADTSTELPAIVCTYPAEDFAAAPRELMVAKGSSETLEFTVPGLPDRSLVVAATLQFVSWDSDHAGAEGTIVVNGGPPIDLPADPAWENAEHATAVEVTGATIAGDNTISFGAGSSVDGSFYRIGAVALELGARVEACPEPPDTPPKPPKTVQLGFADAVYTKRHNWVLRCDFGEGYAFTAKGDQGALDCGGLYDPDGTRTGTATFTFEDLAPATYDITISARHSANRNPEGALFIVDGEAKRIDQTVGEDITVDTWGAKALAGTVAVVLDSDMEPGSDSVTWVRLTPQ